MFDTRHTRTYSYFLSPPTSLVSYSPTLPPTTRILVSIPTFPIAVTNTSDRLQSSRRVPLQALLSSACPHAAPLFPAAAVARTSRYFRRPCQSNTRPRPHAALNARASSRTDHFGSPGSAERNRQLRTHRHPSEQRETEALGFESAEASADGESAVSCYAIG